MLKSVELKQERAKVWEQMKALHTQATEGGRDLTAEEEATWERMEADLERLDKAIEREERFEAEERASATELATSATGGASDEVMTAFRRYLVHGRGALNAAQIVALEAGRGDLGGYLVAPEEFVSELIQAVDDQVVIRKLATVRQITTAANLGVPAIDTDPSDPDWTSEIATGSEDTAMRFGKRELSPHPLAKRVKVSKKLLRMTAGEADAIVRERLAYKFAVAQEKAFLTGDGVNKPLGLFQASADGITTARDVTCGTATAFTGDGLIDLKYTLKAQYWNRPGTRWIVHRDGMKQIRKLKNVVDGQYLWQPGLAGGEPSTILDIPYVVSEFAPNTFTTGLYVAILGDFATYWIAEALDVQLQHLLELYAESNQDGFIGRAELDGMPTLAEAFVRGKLA